MDFEEYVLARGPSLLRLAYVLTRDTYAAEDLTQAALADAWRHWSRVQRAGDPDAYVRKVLVNRHVSQRRRRWWGERPADRDAVEQAAVASTTQPDPTDRVGETDQARQVLDALPPRARAVLVLRYYADLDDAAIADLLGISPSTVRATASRALADLRASLALAPVEPSSPEESP